VYSKKVNESFYKRTEISELKGFTKSAAQRNKLGWVLVAHTCNPSYSEGRDQEDCGSKPAQGYSS
jgi:hypothetical protein